MTTQKDVPFVKEKVYKLYLSTNLINGMKYIGVTSTTGKAFERYFGSNKRLKQDLKKYRRENFKKIVLRRGNKEDIYAEERRLIEEGSLVNNSNYYNEAAGGQGFTSEEVAIINKERTPEQKKKASIKRLKTLGSKGLKDIRKQQILTMGPKRLSEAVKKGHAGKTLEQKRKSEEQRQKTLGPKRRSAAAVKGQASRTPKERSEITRQGHITRGIEGQKLATERRLAAINFEEFGIAISEAHAERTFKEKQESERQRQETLDGKQKEIAIKGVLKKSKLQINDVLIIREMFDDGKSCVEIGKIFGVNRKTIHDIKTGKTWSWLNQDYLNRLAGNS